MSAGLDRAEDWAALAVFPESEMKQALADIAEFVVARGR